MIGSESLDGMGGAKKPEISRSYRFGKPA